jgi:hypothetical protein
MAQSQSPGFFQKSFLKKIVLSGTIWIALFFSPAKCLSGRPAFKV